MEKNLQPQKHQQRIPDSSPEVVGFFKKIARKMHCADGWTRDGASNVLFLCSARRQFCGAILGINQIWGEMLLTRGVLGVDCNSRCFFLKLAWVVFRVSKLIENNNLP